MKITLLCMITSFAVSFATAEEWSAPIGKKKFGASTKKLPGVVSPNLDFGAYSTNDELVVYVRNGKHKMGPKSIAIKMADSPATLQVQRVLISKPLSLIKKKKDGAHLFDEFKSADKAYEIYYHVKRGKLDTKVTISSKS